MEVSGMIGGLGWHVELRVFVNEHQDYLAEPPDAF